MQRINGPETLERIRSESRIEEATAQKLVAGGGVEEIRSLIKTFRKA